ncbi:MAG: hypothetical protein RI565_10150 [Schleiferiaceae bacterium]|nr:hypothetical protein [Schleiferiaceae bacterium]
MTFGQQRVSHLVIAFFITLAFTTIHGFYFQLSFDHVLRDLYNHLFAFQRDTLAHLQFPHGPLAFLQYPLAIGNNYIYALLFQGAISFLASGLILRLNEQKGGSALQGVLGAIVILLIQVPFYVVVLLLPLSFRGRGKASAWLLAALFTSLGILIRSYLGISLLAIYYGLWVGHLLDQQKPLSWKDFLPGLYPWLSLALVWLALFQGLQGFWKFFVGQYYLLTGSSVATSLYPTNSMLLVVIFLGLLAALFWLGKRLLSWQYWLPLLLWALLTLKYAFSRQDAGHLQALFELLIFLGLFWTLVLPRKRWTNISLSLGVVLVFSVLCKYAVGLNRFSTTDFHPVVYLQRLLQPQHTKTQYWLKWEKAKRDARGAVKLNGVAFPWNHLLSSELPPPPFHKPTPHIILI